MKGWLQGWVIAGGFALLLLPQAALAQARDLAEVRAAVGRSGEQSTQALNRALGVVSDAETRAAIERAKGEVLATQNRAFQDLDRAERGLIPEERERGLATAFEATRKHQNVLQDVLARLQALEHVPKQAKDAIQHAMDVSGQGTRRIADLRAGKRGQELPAPTFSPPPGQEDRRSPPTGPRPFDGRGGSGPPGGSRPGR